jgi:hypothetical protein
MKLKVDITATFEVDRPLDEGNQETLDLEVSDGVRSAIREALGTLDRFANGDIWVVTDVLEIGR